MAVVNGQIANQNTFNNAFMSRTSLTTQTVAKVALENPDNIDSGPFIGNIQKALNKAFEGVGSTGEADAAINDYVSNNYILNGDSRKTAIGKIDTQLALTQADLDDAEALILDHETRLDGHDVDIAGHETRLDGHDLDIADHEIRIGDLENNNMTIGGIKTFSNNVIIQGDLEVQGVTTSINSTNLEVEDQNILVNKNGTDGSAEGAGMDIERPSGNAGIRFDSTLASKFKIGLLTNLYEVIVSGVAQIISGVKDFVSGIKVDTIDESTLNLGVTVDGVLVKDGLVDGRDVSTDGATLDGHTTTLADHETRIDDLELGGGSGVGGITFLTNGNAEIDTAGWAGYTDAAGTEPVDGTGGVAPSITLSRNTSDPLNGLADFKLTKPASNCQGQGFSYDMSIPRGFLPAVIRTLLNYRTTANYVDGDFRIFLYNVTQSKLIRVDRENLDATELPNPYASTWQTDASLVSENYRLILHCATTSALAYDIYFDDVVVGPSSIAKGPIISKPVTFTPVLSGSATAFEIVGTKWREGNILRMKIYTRLNSLTGDAIGIVLPDGLKVDTDIIHANKTTLGRGSRQRVSGGTLSFQSFSGGVLHAYYQVSAGDDRVLITDLTTGDGNTYFNARAYTGLFNSGDGFSMDIAVPIKGWASNQVVSEDAGGRLVAFRATRTTNQAASGDAVILYNSVSTANGCYDTCGAFNITNGRFYAPESGLYQFFAKIYTDTNAGENVHRFKVNGADLNYRTEYNALTNDSGNVLIAETIFLNKGDYVEVQTSGDASYNILGNTAYQYFSGYKIQSNQQVTASEIVSAVYKTSSGQSIPNGSIATIVNFDTKEEDTHNAVTVGASWKFTAPVSGLYEISALMLFADYAWSVGEIVTVRIYKNGAQAYIPVYSEIQASTTMFKDASIPSRQIKLNKGEYISLYIEHNRSGGSSSLSANSAYNWISIKKIGGVA